MSRSLRGEIDPKSMPQHVALVMDGNGRWAKQRGLPRTAGHTAGEQSLFDTIEGGLDIDLKWMTIYAFSTENWNRPKPEVRFLMNFNRDILHRRRDELDERGVRMRFIGRRDWRLPRSVLHDIEVAEDYLARPGDLLFAWSGSLTVHRWFRPEGIVNQHIFKVIPTGYPMWIVKGEINRSTRESSPFGLRK